MATRRPDRGARSPGTGSGTPGQAPGSGGAASARRAAGVLAGLLAEPLAAAGYDLEDVSVRRAGRRHTVAVAVDRDGGVDLDAVAAATAVVSHVLDERDGSLPAQLQGAYDLEVSSRGTSAPLTLPRHWRRARGRLVQVRCTDGTSVTGRIAGADDRGADLDVDGRPVRVPYDEVRTALVQLEFRRSATEPADLETDAAAEAEEETP
ncbi:MAG TPA: ribosome maturation factor RimP [Mycobacteriales bacterium]